MRGRWGYVVAATVLAGGLGSGALILFQQLGRVTEQLQQIVVPGEHEIALAQAGTHTIFHEQRAAVGGRYFASDRQLNGLRLRLQGLPGGDEIAIESPSARTHYSLADREGEAIATFHIVRAGTYRLRAWYPEAAYDTTAVLAIGQGVERRLVTAIVGSLAASFGGLIGSAAIAVATFARGRRNRQHPMSERIVEEVHVKTRVLGIALVLSFSGQALASGDACAQETPPASRAPLASVESRWGMCTAI